MAYAAPSSIQPTQLVVVFIISILFFAYIFYHIFNYVIIKNKTCQDSTFSLFSGSIAGFPLASLFTQDLRRLSIGATAIPSRFDINNRVWEAMIPTPASRVASQSGRPSHEWAGKLRFRFFRAGEGFPGISFEFHGTPGSSGLPGESIQGTLVPLAGPASEAVLTGTITGPQGPSRTVAQIVRIATRPTSMPQQGESLGHISPVQSAAPLRRFKAITTH